jgi:hypothetical protein
MKGVGTPASEVVHQIKLFGSNLLTALYFTASGVFSTTYVQKLFIPENVKYFSLSHHNHFLVTKMFAKKKSAAAKNIFNVYLGMLTLFLWMTFKIRRTVECVMLFFLTTSRDDAPMRFLMLCNVQHISHFFVVSKAWFCNFWLDYAWLTIFTVFDGGF